MSERVRYLAKIGKRRDGREGSREILRHVMEGVALPGRNETGVVDRVVDFETNLPYGFKRDSDSTLVAHALARHKHNKAARDVWHIILSGEDNRADLGTLRALRARFLKTYFGDKVDWVSCVHGDHDHLHLHLVIANAHQETGKPFNISHIDTVKSIATLGFAEGMPGVLNAQGKIPFAWRKSTIGEGMSRKGSYANVRKGNSLELAERIKDNPAQVLGILIKTKEVEAIYSDKGAVSFRYKKTKFSLRDINYFLKQQGSPLFLDTDLTNCDSPPVFISASDLKDVEHDMTCLAKVFQPQLHKVATSQCVKHVEPDIVTELLGCLKYRKTLGKLASGPLGWFFAILDLIAGIEEMDMPITRSGRKMVE